MIPGPRGRQYTMTSVTLYHNPRCSKSRQTLALLEHNDVDFTTIEYLETPLTADQIKALAAKLGVPVRDITRTGQTEYQEQHLEDAPDDQLAEAIAATPILMQRPIVVKGDSARIGRPPESVLEILG